MEEFKELKKIMEVDSRNLHYVITNVKTGEDRYMSLVDVYRSVENITLSINVPDNIKRQFDVAKNLAVYSWFSTSFHQISEMKAYSAVESALKLKLDNKKDSFKRMIKTAVCIGLVNDSGFEHIKDGGDEGSVEFSRTLPRLMSESRNRLAHGSTSFHSGSAVILMTCAGFINQLFDECN